MTWKETDTDMKYRRLTGVMVSVAFLGLLTGCAAKKVQNSGMHIRSEQPALRIQ